MFAQLAQTPAGTQVTLRTLRKPEQQAGQLCASCANRNRNPDSLAHIAQNQMKTPTDLRNLRKFKRAI